ncbi:MAG: tRNA lysidine(34) synthetase TilS [Gemmatimonadota bacterium]
MIETVLAAIAPLETPPRLLLAVSGGLDSMVLLEAFVRSGLRNVVAVATFDHGTGAHAQEALDLVRRVAARRRVEFIAGRAGSLARDEAALRKERWRFLRAEASVRDATIVTAHNLDDQIETVAMRILRDAGARGLAGLLAPSSVERPLIGVSRAEILRAAAEWKLQWVEDPTNQSRLYLRNRVRHDILPALRAVRPDIDSSLISLGVRAAKLRAEIDEAATTYIGNGADTVLRVRDELLTDLDAAARAVIWPALLSRWGVVMDRRGIMRLASLDDSWPPGKRVQLSGGVELIRTRAGLEVSSRTALQAAAADLAPGLEFGRFVFRTALVPDEKGTWGAWLDERPALVRPWEPGDRVAAGPRGARRRVKRFLTEARIAAPDRKGWPVVMQGGEITWVPGVCRVKAAAARHGGAARYYTCERIGR